MKKLEVLKYDPSWAKQYELEAERIKKALKDDFVAIHHIGSTAVPDLAAKPKIDIIAEVKNLDFNHQELLKAHYRYRGNFNLPLRECFTYRSPEVNVNLHIFEKGDPEIERNLLFRDYLRNNEEYREKYAKLKYQLLENEELHKKARMMHNYTLAKNDLIQEIVKRAGFDKMRFMICLLHEEWDAVKKYRNKYFSEKFNGKDPYTASFDDENHMHFVFYKGINIIGYIHLQFLSENRVIIRLFIIDEKFSNEDYEKKLIELVEKYLRVKNYKTFYINTAISKLKFYEKLGFNEMSFDDPDSRKTISGNIIVAKKL